MFKNANNNIYQMFQERLKIYEKRAKVRPDQSGNLAGWQRRIRLLKQGCDMLVEKGYYKPKNADMATPFDKGYDGLLKQIDDTMIKKGKTREGAKNEFLYRIDKLGIPTGYPTDLQQSALPFTREQIGAMTPEEFSKNENLIMNQLRHGLIKETKPNYSNFVNSETKKSEIYTREDIAKMSSDEYSKKEKEIMAQMQTIGIPYSKDVPEKMKIQNKSSGSGNKGSSDGKWVTINGNHVLIDK